MCLSGAALQLHILRRTQPQGTSGVLFPGDALIQEQFYVHKDMVLGVVRE